MFAPHVGGPSSPRSRELPAGLADRVRPTTPVAGRTLPVPPPLAPLFSGGSLRRGTTTTVTGRPGHGATTLALALLAAASEAGSWCAAVGLPDPGVVAAAGLGLDLRRVVFVPHPGPEWAEAVGDLLSGVDAVLVRPPGRARLTAARHLTARARERQAALVVLLEGVRDWPRVETSRSRWERSNGKGSVAATGICAVVGPRSASVDAVPRAGSPSARCGSPPTRVQWRRRTAALTPSRVAVRGRGPDGSPRGHPGGNPDCGPEAA